MIYLFTKEGEVIRLNKALKEQKRTKFKFAHYSVATVIGGKVYALDQKGSLIVLDKALTKSRIYDVGEVKRPAFISGTKLYKDGDVIELSKLGYE
jgi:predicted transglutaminase-like protease